LRALELRAYLVSDARKRGAVINRRSGKLPAVNAEYDAAISQFLRIGDELQLSKGDDRLDLVSRLQQAAGVSNVKRDAFDKRGKAK